MKKVFTTAVAIIITSSTMLLAQVPFIKPMDYKKEFVAGEQVEMKKSHQNSKRATGSGWFETAVVLGASNANISYMTLFPDTNALFQYSQTGGGNTYSKNYVNSLGSIVDPRSQIYKDKPFVASKFTSYTVDSVRFYFTYRRFNTDTAMVDTLVMTTFDRTSISRGFVGSYAGAVDYSSATLTARGTGITTTRILLTKRDTSSGLIERVMPVNKSIAGSGSGANYFGAVFTYLPGYRAYKTTEPFDTVTNFVTRDTSSKKANGLRMLAFFDPAKWVENEVAPPVNGDRVYNHGIFANQNQRYRLGTTIPDFYYSAFFTTSHMFPFIEYKLSTNNLSLNALNSAKISDIYPNPTRNQDVVVEVNSTVESPSEIVVTDMTGKVISNISYDLNIGVNEISLSTQGFAKGIYVVNVKGNGINSVSKLIVE